MNFYLFDQNNSGGSFDFNEEEGITLTVVIQAENAENANKRAEEIGLYFDGCNNEIDCDCCGDRWSTVEENKWDKISKLSELRDRISFGDVSEGKEIAIHWANKNFTWGIEEAILPQETEKMNFLNYFKSFSDYELNELEIALINEKEIHKCKIKEMTAIDKCKFKFFLL